MNLALASRVEKHRFTKCKVIPGSGKDRKGNKRKKQKNIFKDLLTRVAVPNVFGTRDWFPGRQFFHRSGVGGRGWSGSNVSKGEQQMKLRLLVYHSPPAVWPGS